MIRPTVIHITHRPFRSIEVHTIPILNRVRINFISRTIRSSRQNFQIIQHSRNNLSVSRQNFQGNPHHFIFNSLIYIRLKGSPGQALNLKLLKFRIECEVLTVANLLAGSSGPSCQVSPSSGSVAVCGSTWNGEIDIIGRGGGVLGACRRIWSFESALQWEIVLLLKFCTISMQKLAQKDSFFDFFPGFFNFHNFPVTHKSIRHWNNHLVHLRTSQRWNRKILERWWVYCRWLSKVEGDLGGNEG